MLSWKGSSEIFHSSVAGVQSVKTWHLGYPKGNQDTMFSLRYHQCESESVASPRGGGQWGNLPPPPSNLRSDTPRDRCGSEEKMGVGLHDLLRHFTCTDATADVLWSYDYEKEGVVEVVEETGQRTESGTGTRGPHLFAIRYCQRGAYT